MPELFLMLHKPTVLASCLIYAQPFRHTSLPQTTTPWLAAQATT